MATRENTRRKGEERAEWVKPSSVLSCLHLCVLFSVKSTYRCVILYIISLFFKSGMEFLNVLSFFLKLKIEKCLPICNEH